MYVHNSSSEAKDVRAQAINDMTALSRALHANKNHAFRTRKTVHSRGYLSRRLFYSHLRRACRRCCTRLQNVAMTTRSKYLSLLYLLTDRGSTYPWIRHELSHASSLFWIDLEHCIYYRPCLPWQEAEQSPRPSYHVGFGSIDASAWGWTAVLPSCFIRFGLHSSLAPFRMMMVVMLMFATLRRFRIVLVACRCM